MVKRRTVKEKVAKPRKGSTFKGKGGEIVTVVEIGGVHTFIEHKKR